MRPTLPLLLTTLLTVLAVPYARAGEVAETAAGAAESAGRQAPAVGELADLAWIAGCWVTQEGEARMEECWLAPAGGLMLGVARTIGPSGESFFEFLRLEATAEGVTYLASPSGRPAVPFKRVESGEQRSVFANPEHDFPQRIHYRLDGDGRLHTRIEDTAGSRGREWVWTRGEAWPPGR